MDSIWMAHLLGKRFSSKRSQPKFGSVCAFRVPDPSQWLILSVAVAFLGVFSAFMLFVFYRCKATCHNRQLHYLKAQMNSIEMRAAQESKAFDELQTNLCRTYSFFNTSPASLHPVLRELTVVQDRALQVESSLRQLHCLFQNRIFLLCVVRSIDSNKYLLVKDRVYVGSLFLVVLQLTDVLKQLLRDLIRRNVETKFQPKILFHRAESVVERMFVIHKFVYLFVILLDRMFDIFDDIFDNDIQLVENEEIPLQKKRKIVTRSMAKYSKKPSELIALANSKKQGVNELLIDEILSINEKYKSTSHDLDKMVGEIATLTKELRQEKEHSQHVEQLRKGPELQIKEMQVRLDEAESSPIKNRKKITKLKERIQLLEQELDGEQRRHQETDKNYRKAERRVKKVTFKIENKNKEDIDEDGSIKIKLEDRIRALEEDLNGEQLRNGLLESKLNKEMEKKKKYKKLLKQKKENEIPSTSIAVPTVPIKLKDFKPLPLNKISFF
uniref:Plexin cytoplasmic RasGAP domain-containing protein n=2 Tax=Meloidogyne TaxID=189290 RepID=A0A914NHU4_MELIC